MKYRKAKLFRITVALLVAAMLLCAGCQKEGGSLADAVTEPQPETTQPANEPVKKPDSKPEEATQPEAEPEPMALADLRQAMEGGTQTFAAAYLGYAYLEDQQLYDYIASYAPQLCKTMPFLLQTPEANMIGGGSGDLFYIVPADPESSVSVYRAVMGEAGNYEYTHLLYSSEKGDPILLLCNDSGYMPDTQVVLSDNAGVETVWYPQLNGYQFLDPLWDDAGEDLLWDFSPYAEDLASDYAAMQTWGWVLPTEADLIGKAWGEERTLPDGRRETVLLAFDDGTAYVRWNEGYGDADHEFINVPWTLGQENGFAVVTFDFGEFAGTLRYDVLYAPDYGGLYTMMDASGGYVEPGYEALLRYLDPRSMDAPDPVEMVGTWRLYRTEIEGSVEEVTDGTCTVVIRGETQENLTISYTDGEYTQHNFTDKPLQVSQGVMYTGCGNELWQADVDHVGPWDTTYAVTLLEDGSLLIQFYGTLDGAPTVSYQWFQRISS